MKRYKGDNRPKLKPVKQIELSDSHVKLRVIIAAVLALIGVALLSYTAASCLSKNNGWREIEAGAAAKEGCSNEFVFNYNLGASGAAASAEYKKISSLYTEASVYAYRVFNDKEVYPDMGNLGSLNRSVGETVELDKTLYDALQLLEDSGRRDIYFAPVFEYYSSVFNSVEDSEAERFDPVRNTDAASDVAELSAFAADPDAVDIQLLGDGRAKLSISEEYKRFAAECGIEAYVGFGWMKNAFIADCLAERITAGGYTLGIISSYDGFCRNLYSKDEDFSFNIFDRSGGQTYMAARMNYSGARSIVLFRSYPQNSLDVMHYYKYANGDIRVPYIDVSDGIPKCAVSSLTCSSTEKSCAEILAESMPLYIADSLDVPTLTKLEKRGIHFVWCDGETVYYTEKDLTLTDVYSDGVLDYKTEYVK